MLGNKEIMAQNIIRLMEEKGLTRIEVCEALNIKYTTFVDWIKAVSYPRIDKIELMAKFFGVQKKDLVEEYHPKTMIEELMEIAEKSSPSEIKRAIEILKILKKENEI